MNDTLLALSGVLILLLSCVLAVSVKEYKSKIDVLEVKVQTLEHDNAAQKEMYESIIKDITEGW